MERQRRARANAAVYFLDARGLVAAAGDLNADAGQTFGGSLRETAHVAESVGNSILDLDASSAGADRLAEETGGFSVKRTNDLGRGLDRVGRESAAYYLLGYYPSDERRDGSYRKIGVSVSRRGAQVRARKGYYAPAPSGKQRKATKAQPDAALPVLQRAVDAPFALTSVPLRVSAYVLGNAAPGQANVVVATDIDVRGLAFERHGDRHDCWPRGRHGPTRRDRRGPIGCQGFVAGRTRPRRAMPWQSGGLPVDWRPRGRRSVATARRRAGRRSEEAS